MEYDMTQFFESCVQLYAELTDTDPSTYPAAGTPYGPELTDLEDGQGGPRGEITAPAEEALAAVLNIETQTGPPDVEVEVPGLAAEPSSDDPQPPSPSGVL